MRVSMTQTPPRDKTREAKREKGGASGRERQTEEGGG